MVRRPVGMNAFEFSVLSSLRAAQLLRGCTPRVQPSEKVIVTAQHEIAEHKVERAAAVDEQPEPAIAVAAVSTLPVPGI